VGNLVDNSQRHGAGVVRIVVEREPDRVLVHVDDAGPGLDAEVADRIFEPFARGEGASSSGGAGLGLAIAQEQATVLGATLGVGMSPYGGARFIFTIPVQDIS
jgi:signal transduction histidine kinase